MKYVLPISQNYLAEWSEWHAIRELLQNAMDAADAGGEKPLVQYDQETKILTIASPRERLPRKSLLMGVTTKADDDSQRGQFGEGYKLALLVLCRRMYEVTVHNGGEVWTSCFEEHPDFDGEKVLTISVDPASEGEDYDGVAFKIRGLSQVNWNLIASRWLPDAKEDQILDGMQYRGCIFSGGLFVTQCKSLLMGYNFARHRLSLGRDRDVVGDWDVKIHCAVLWQQCDPSQVTMLMALMQQSAGDVEYVDYVPAQTAQAVIKAYEAQYGENVVPVQNQAELDTVRGQGYCAQIVCDALRKIVTGAKKFIYLELRTPEGKMRAFQDKYAERLDLDIRENLEVLVSESRGWR